MTDHLNIRFEFDFSQSRNPRSEPGSMVEMKVHLERMFNVRDVVVDRLAFQDNGKLIVDAQLPFLTYDIDQAPATKLAYERFYLQQRLLLSDAPDSRLEILSMQSKGETYGAYELLHRHTEEITLRHMKINKSGGEMYIRPWLTELLAEGLTDAELLNQASSVLNHLKPIAGDDWDMPLHDGKQPAFEKALNDIARPVLMHARQRDQPIRAQTLVAELKTFVKFFTAYSQPQFAAPEITLEASVQDLASRHSLDQDTTMTPVVFTNILDQVSTSSDNGQWLRYGMFLAAQLALEVIDGKGGTQNIADLHAQLAEGFGAEVAPRNQGLKI
jgi:hypothetical protein